MDAMRLSLLPGIALQISPIVSPIVPPEPALDTAREPVWAAGSATSSYPGRPPARARRRTAVRLPVQQLGPAADVPLNMPPS